MPVQFLQPATLTEALEVKAARPQAVPIAGGTDVLVGINFGRLRPEAVLDLGRVPELRGWDGAGARVRLGAGTTYQELTTEMGSMLPALAIASRTVGSPQIRNRGTIGGNLATASPAGDAHPPLLATGAEIEVGSASGSRRIPVGEFFLGPKRSALADGELILAVHVPRATGPQQFAKVGTRNAVLDWERRGPLTDSAADRFGELVSQAARPIDDVRGTSGYRRHALRVLATRTLRWTWADYQAGRGFSRG